MSDFKVGDIIQMQGASVPRIWWERHFRVDSVDEAGLPTLSLLPPEGETPEQFARRAKETWDRVNARLQSPDQVPHTEPTE